MVETPNKNHEPNTTYQRRDFATLHLPSGPSRSASSARSEADSAAAAGECPAGRMRNPMGETPLEFPLNHVIVTQLWPNSRGFFQDVPIVAT